MATGITVCRVLLPFRQQSIGSLIVALVTDKQTGRPIICLPSIVAFRQQSIESLIVALISDNKVIEKYSIYQKNK